MSYVDGYLLAVPTAKRADYTEFAERCAPYFTKYGALAVAECWGDDVPGGEVTSMPMAVKAGEDETVVFSWVEWPSKAHRDEAMAKLMDEMTRDLEGVDMPFDGKRMIFGGFEKIVSG